ncbi:MAG: DinB family protein [Spirochaetaceae bacterium]|nr:DinB family protein [Spirochaetaceae bacterium]
MTLQESFLIFAKHNAESNAAVAALLDKLSTEEREKERGSFYHSLSNLLLHIIGGTVFLCETTKSVLSKNNAAVKALDTLAAVPKFSEERDGTSFTDARWQELKKALDTTDKAYCAFVQALGGDDLQAQADVAFLKWDKPTVPVAFMLQQIVTHNEHHRGQISQILDELKIDNNYSGIAASALK